MGEVYSHLSEEERQVIQIEVGNGASIRGIADFPGHRSCLIAFHPYRHGKRKGR